MSDPPGALGASGNSGGGGLGWTPPAMGNAVLAPPVAAVPQALGSNRPAQPVHVAPLPPTAVALFQYLSRLLHAAVGLRPAQGPVELQSTAYVGEMLDATTSARDRGGLRHMNRRARELTQESNNVLALIRSLSGLANELDGSTTSAYGRPSGAYTALKRAANALAGAVEGHVSALSPLAVTHPDFFRDWRTDAANLHSLLGDPPGRQAFQAFRDDASIPLDQRRDILEFGRLAVATAATEVSLSTRQEEIARDVEEALVTPSNDSLLSLVAALGSLALSNFGALPGPDASSVLFIKIVGTWKLVQIHNDAAQLGSYSDRLVRWLVRSAAFTSEQQTAFLAHMEEFRTRRAAGVADWSRPRAEARDLLGSRFQAGPRLTAALEVLNLIQLIVAIRGPTEGERSTTQAITEITAASLAAAPGFVVTLDRFYNPASNVVSSVAVPVGRGRALLRTMAAGIESASGGLNVTFGVLGILGGTFTLVAAVENPDYPDPWMFSVGTLQVASGILLMIPGGQPFGVVIGAIATAMAARDTLLDAVRTGTARGYRKLFKAVHEARSSWDSSPDQPGSLLVVRMGLRAQVDALEQAIGNTTFADIHTGLSREMYDGYQRRLMDLGLSRDDARAMLDSDLIVQPG